MTQATAGITFGPYRLDPDGARLWNGTQLVPLQRRPLAVLHYLAARPGVPVSRDELIKTLWAGTYVTKAVLKVAVRAIREALEDDVESPRYIETVGREGYRFIGEGTAGVGTTRLSTPAETDTMVGRTEDLAALRRGLAQARDGARKVVFVTGEAGVGKTTLIDRFVAEVEGEGQAGIVRGQCLEQYGEGEAYLPVLEAIGGLVRDAGAAGFGEVVRRHAPTWVSHLPPLEADAPEPAREGAAIATVPARMLREMADALEVFTQRHTLVLVLEDLQWSDRSTVDLIRYLARRRQPARLMVIGSLRPADVIVHDHPVRIARQELQANAQCEEIPLELLSLAEVKAYVGARFGAGSTDEMPRLAFRIHERTEGNALFMVNVVNDLVVRGALVRREGRWQVTGSIEQATDRVPTGLHELIARRMQRLPPEAHRVLEAASVAGDEFAGVAVAGALDDDVETVEEICETLASHGALITDAGTAEWPDGSVSGRYRFVHALYRRVLYEGIGPARCARLHRAIGLRTEAAFAARGSERAAELAMHFARGHDHARALAYHVRAGYAALHRHAAHEAVSHFTAALDGLAHDPEPPGRAERELELVVASATLLMAIRGYAAPETERAFARARALCDAAPASVKLFPVLRGLVSYHHVRAELADAHDVGELLLGHAARHADDVTLRVQAHYGHGATLFHMGAFEAARAHLDAALRDYDPAMHRTHQLVYGGYDPGVACSLWSAWTLGLMGHLDEAAERDREGLALARRLTDAFSLAWAHQAAAITRQLFGDWAASETLAAEAVRLAEEHGFPHVLGMATVNRAWALIMQGQVDVGIPLLRKGVTAVDATGAGLVRPSYLGMLAAAEAIEGNRHAAEQCFEQGISEVERTGERLHEVPLLIGKSHLLASGQPSRKTEEVAEACLRRALEVARAQGARVLELRAAVALARHWRKRRRAGEARTLLTTTHAWCESLPPAVPEIVAARHLLTGLGASPG